MSNLFVLKELSKREDAVSLPNIDIYPSNERPGGGRQVNDDVEDYEKQPNYGKGKINQLFEYVFENLNPKKLYNEKIKNSKWFKMIFE